MLRGICLCNPTNCTISTTWHEDEQQDNWKPHCVVKTKFHYQISEILGLRIAIKGWDWELSTLELKIKKKKWKMSKK